MTKRWNDIMTYVEGALVLGAITAGILCYMDVQKLKDNSAAVELLVKEVHTLHAGLNRVNPKVGVPQIGWTNDGWSVPLPRESVEHE